MRSLTAAALLSAGALAACDNEPTTPSRMLDGNSRPASLQAGVEASNSWTNRAPMNTARSFLTAIGAGNGLVYAIGGEDQQTNALSTVEAYQPSTNRWSPKAPLPVPLRSASGAVAIGDYIYVPGGISGGFGRKSLHIYNIRTNTWTTGADLPIVSANGAAAGINGKVYVVTPGILAGDTTGLPHLHRYDPGTNKWVELARPPRHHTHGVMRPLNGKLYLVGGVEPGGIMSVPSSSADPANTLDVYDPATNRWTQRAPMPTSRAGATGQVLGGKLYVVGGCTPISEIPLAKVEAYDPATNRWTTRSPLPGARCLLSSGAVNGQLFAVGGFNSSGSVVATNQAYTP